MPNTDLLVDALAHVELEEARWNQGAWGYTELSDELAARLDTRPSEADGEVHLTQEEAASCGTAYCLAGWTCVLAGEQLDWKRLGKTSEAHAQYTRSGWPIGDLANSLLGLDAYVNRGSQGTPGDLFAGDNTLDTLYEIAADQIDMDEELLRKKVAERKNVVLVELAHLPDVQG